jgi:hypothetical protein
VTPGLALPFEPPRVLDAFRDASADLVSTRLLQQRVDRKYLVPKRLLDQLLSQLSAGYELVRAAGLPAATYDTLYFDTADRQLYEAHRRGRGRRYKVRIRHHLDRRLSFLEVKRKDSEIRTTKARLERPFGGSTLDADALEFIGRHFPIPARCLLPQVSIAFRRVTLVGALVHERVTIDWDVEVRNGERRELLPGLAIVEVKQARYSNAAPAVNALRALHLHEQSISKYCLATVKLAGVRDNVFRPVLRVLEQLSA